MTNRVIKICNFVHYFFREGGYIDSDQFSLLLFSLFMVGGGVQMEIVPNSLFPLFFFLAGFPNEDINLGNQDLSWSSTIILSQIFALFLQLKIK